jgi:hypothetical protein
LSQPEIVVVMATSSVLALIFVNVPRLMFVSTAGLWHVSVSGRAAISMVIVVLNITLKAILQVSSCHWP